MLKRQVQTALRVLYPPSCAGCSGLVDSEFALCGPCWRQLPLISGPVCDGCGVPVLAEAGDHDAQCDDCSRTPRPWDRGRAAMQYKDLARRLILGLKHGDRQDVAIAAAAWLHRSAQPLMQDDTLLVPVPLHWSRMFKRRYNQSALLAQHLALKQGCGILLDGLQRVVKTQSLDGASAPERFERLTGAIQLNRRRADLMRDRAVLLVDDVMTSGATLGACAEVCRNAGARRVDVLVLARVGKDD